MANGRFRHSRSPIRAVTTSQRAAGRVALHRARPASGDYFDTVPGAGIADERLGAFACPNCGASLHLQLGMSDERADIGTDLQPAPQAPPLPDFEETVTDFKRELLGRALEENGGVMTRAAKAIGLKYTTFVAMAHRLGVLEDGSAEASS